MGALHLAPPRQGYPNQAGATKRRNYGDTILISRADPHPRLRSPPHRDYLFVTLLLHGNKYGVTRSPSVFGQGSEFTFTLPMRYDEGR